MTSCDITILQIAVHAEGRNDETPFTFASAVPGLTFHWSATNMDVHSLVSVYDKVFNCINFRGYLMTC